RGRASCCKTTIARNCYNLCRAAGGARQVFASTCGCKIISGNKCPSNFRKMDLLPESGEPEAIKYCNIGCSSTVCDNMNHVFRGKEMKINVELCFDACVSLCNGTEAAVASVAA
ncbi:hypothetical protein BRADI_1g57297v3, partial [Brachypodium distachyon]